MIQTLRMSRRGVQVEVQVGTTQYGAPITATAAFTRADLADVLAPLDAAVTAAVRESLDKGRTQEILDDRVRTEVVKSRQALIRMATLNAEAAVEQKHRQAMRLVQQELTNAQRELRLEKHANTRLQQELSATSTERGNG